MCSLTENTMKPLYFITLSKLLRTSEKRESPSSPLVKRWLISHRCLINLHCRECIETMWLFKAERIVVVCKIFFCLLLIAFTNICTIMRAVYSFCFIFCREKQIAFLSYHYIFGKKQFSGDAPDRAHISMAAGQAT